MLRAVVTIGDVTHVQFVASEEETAAGDEHHVECEFPEQNAEGETVCGAGPSPIMPEAKELAWGIGAFVVMALLLRFVLYPKLQKGTAARYASIREGHEQADRLKANAKTEVSDYESAVAKARADAHGVVEQARAQVESERQAAIAAANAEIAQRREAAAAQAAAARQAASGEVASAVTSVTTRTVELAIGRRPDDSVIRRSVDDAMNAGVAS